MKQMEGGQIVNTHGIHGEVKIQPWCDSAEFLCGFDRYYIDGAPVRVLAARAHKGCVLAALEGINDISTAMTLKNKVIFIDCEHIKLPDGKFFIADLIGLTVRDEATGNELGKLVEVLTLPANDVYVVRGSREYMIPVVQEFVKSVDLTAGLVTVHLIPGMEV